MDQKDVERELSSNRLSLQNAGTEGIPAKLMYIGSHSIGGPDDEDLSAEVYAYTKTGKLRTLFCCSFMVRIGSSYEYYYRDLLYEVNELVYALRIRHGYKGTLR